MMQIKYQDIIELFYIPAAVCVGTLGIRLWFDLRLGFGLVLENTRPRADAHHQSPAAGFA